MRNALQDEHLALHTRVVDSYKYAALVLSRVVSDGYLQMVKTVPQMYRYIYRRAERATEVGPFRTWAHQFTASNLRPLLQKEHPDIVVCTHAFPCGAMAAYKNLYPDAPPVIGVVTDFAVHGYWMYDNVDGYAVATPAMRDKMLQRGISPGRVHVTGIPVDPRFAAARGSRSELRDALALPRDRSVVLMMGGGLGMGPIVKMLRRLENVAMPMCAVVIAGRNARLEARVREAAAELHYPVRALRFVENVDEYMFAADLLLTKPGGLTSAEALVAGVPMILLKPLPGQEERNARYLTERHAAVRARTASECERAVRELLAFPDRRTRMLSAIATIAAPHAAHDVASIVTATARRETTRKEMYA